MAALTQDLFLEADVIEERRTRGLDHFDEVWEGTYVMAPMANNQHQRIVNELATISTVNVDWQRLGQTFPGVNVSDRRVDWTDNYRVPDLAVFMNDTAAENHDTFWYGGPDFAVEIVSRGEQPLDKVSFYASVGTRELLVIQCDSWKLQLFRGNDARLELVGVSDLESMQTLRSEVLPLNWQLVRDQEGEALIVTHQARDQHWRVRV